MRFPQQCDRHIVSGNCSLHWPLFHDITYHLGQCFLLDFTCNCLPLRSVCWLLCYVWLCVTPWTIDHQTLLSVEFSRQGYQSGLPFPSSGYLPNPGIKPGSPTLQTNSLPSEPPGKLITQELKFCIIIFSFIYVINQGLSTPFKDMLRLCFYNTHFSLSIDSWFIYMSLMISP